MKWGVVILAGGFVPDPLASAIGTPRKGLLKIANKPLVTWTLQAVQSAGFENISLVSGEDMQEYVDSATWVAEQSSQIANARAGVEALGDIDSVLFLPCDSPFLQGNGIRDFVQGVEEVCQGGELWYAAGLCRSEDFDRRFPKWDHPNIHLREGNFMSGAYYATSRQGFLKAADLFEALSNSRKSQLKVLTRFGITTIIKYFLHQLTIPLAEDRFAKVTGGQAMVIVPCDPESVADIDTLEDYKHALRFETRLL